MDPDGSLPDLSMLSASSVDAMLLREECETHVKQNMQEGWDMEKEKEQALVVVMDDTDMTNEKPRSFSDPRQSSTEESQQCSAKTEPEPSTEQSSGTEQHGGSMTLNVISKILWNISLDLIHFCLIKHNIQLLKYFFLYRNTNKHLEFIVLKNFLCKTINLEVHG